MSEYCPLNPEKMSEYYQLNPEKMSENLRNTVRASVKMPAKTD